MNNTEIKKNIVLIGMMGAGKTTVAQELKKNLHDFVLLDIDYEIEQRKSMKISEIFAKEGEEVFRDFEAKLVLEFSRYTNQIISTGGGIVEKFENIYNLKKQGIIFYLETSSKILVERLKNDSSRPLLQGKNMQNVLNQLLEKREIGYKMADFILNTENKSPHLLAKEIIEIYGYGNN